MTLGDPPRKLRWPRSRRFSLSTKGVDAESAYQVSIVAARAVGGRAAYDAARKAWAKAHGLVDEDGLYLAAVVSQPLTFREIVAGLETCGKLRADAIEALERLENAGMLSAP